MRKDFISNMSNVSSSLCVMHHYSESYGTTDFITDLYNRRFEFLLIELYFKTINRL